MRVCRLWVVAAVLVIAGCDTSVQPLAPLSPSTPSPAPAPAPAPLTPPVTSVRTIDVGQKVEIPWLGWDDRRPLFKLTAPATGILNVQLKWQESQWDVGWYTLTYGNTIASGDFQAVQRIQAVAGQTYEFIVSNTWPWDPDPGFVLTSWIE